MSDTLIYKIATRAEWEKAEKTGTFTGAPIDIEDGFIHFSTADTVRETAAKHFNGQNDLLLVAVEVADLGDVLKYEVSRNDMLFPHLYGNLDLKLVKWVRELPLNENQAHIFPMNFNGEGAV